ncbi:hypothetical protein [Miltoncostaea marina]|uniref:hypothetical protein n=1 Tax=Miltoncostaea marina TaxID=2843215 RepID=UPI001C3C5E38|nr:hypothetical protein [Miltoncostaea marina]
MLADLRRLRELQLAQADALGRGDLARLDELHEERMRLQARIGSAGAAALRGADLAEARALADALRRGQADLLERARAAREALGREIAGLGNGRAALAGYRPAPAASSRLLDSAR